MWQKADCYKHHCTTELISWKNVSISTVRRRLCEAGLYGRNAVKKPLERKQNNVKRFQWANIGQYSNGIVFWTCKSKSEIFGSNRRVYVQRRVLERTATPCNKLTVNHVPLSVCVCVGGFCQWQSHGFAPGEGRIKSDRLSQNIAASHDAI